MSNPVNIHASRQLESELATKAHDIATQLVTLAHASMESRREERRDRASAMLKEAELIATVEDAEARRITHAERRRVEALAKRSDRVYGAGEVDARPVFVPGQLWHGPRAGIWSSPRPAPKPKPSPLAPTALQSIVKICNWLLKGSK